MTNFSRHPVTLSQALQHITSGKPRAIFADTPEQALIELEHTDINDYDDNLRIIQVPLKLSVINEGIDKTLTALAALAQSLLPEWELNNHDPAEPVNHRWRERAIALCTIKENHRYPKKSMVIASIPARKRSAPTANATGSCCSAVIGLCACPITR